MLALLEHHHWFQLKHMRRDLRGSLHLPRRMTREDCDRSMIGSLLPVSPKKSLKKLEMLLNPD